MIDTDPALFDGGRRLPLVEDFYTIQGEGFHAGKPASVSYTHLTLPTSIVV